jgi:hypothetical protein
MTTIVRKVSGRNKIRQRQQASEFVLESEGDREIIVSSPVIETGR